MMDKKEFLKRKISLMGVNPSEEQLEQLLLYYEMLTEKNKVMNLTAITEYEEVVVKHFMDSLSLSMVFDSIGLSSLNNEDHEAVDAEQRKREINGKSLIDLGTGAGFPGIPIKIMYPMFHVTLLDSLQKRIHFLDEVVSELHLSEIKAVHYRAEEGARISDYREKFDYCVSRAVANIATLSEYCLPYVKVGGYFISYKTPEIENEIKDAYGAIQKLGGYVRKIRSFTLQETDLERSLVVIEKVKNTPNLYPRKAGTPSKKPLS